MSEYMHVCHEEVTRGGELQPCDKTAVAMRDDPEGAYPVCAHHARGPMIPLSQHDREIAARALREAAYEIEQRRNAISHVGRALDSGRAWSVSRLRDRADLIEKREIDA